MRKKSTQEFSGLPYAVALLNCLIYIWYGSPFISGGWGNLIVFVVNAIGLVLNLAFVSIYLLYAPPASKVIPLPPLINSCDYRISAYTIGNVANS